MNKYKTFEELKEELGDKFDEYMYKANIELLTKIDKAIEYMEQWGKEPDADMYMQMKDYNEFKYLLKILKEDNKDESDE